MSYQVLARKWRPRDFSAFIGQEHAVRAIVNALKQQRLHHAYLFTGTRGVGKTTIARILAKCLNCETGITDQPCNICSACREIDEGRFVDLIEVDAASRTKVEDTRELLDNVQYAPNKARFKIYLIDEVHMLSGHSFNALLKTLEEPPPHVKFLLATTDPQKLPVTVLSRCLQFHLKNLVPELIVTNFSHILQAENIPFEPPALNLLAKAADGSMRDGLSLLDQAIAYGNGQVMTADVKIMLGSIEQTYLFDILSALANREANSLLQTCQTLNEHAIDFAQVLEDLLLLLHQISVAQAIPNITFPENHEPTLALAKQFTPEEVQLYYQIALIGRRDLPLAPTSKTGFEMILLRMLAFRPEEMAIATPSSPAAATTIKSQPNSSAPAPVLNAQTDWNTLLNQLNLSGVTKAFAAHCSLVEVNETTVRLLIDPSHIALLNDKQRDRLAQALSDYYKKPLKVIINAGKSSVPSPAAQQQQQQSAKQIQATAAIAEDKNIQTLLTTFSATILPDSIKAKD